MGAGTDRAARTGGGVVTPEAVPLDFDEAGVGSRSVAYAVDTVVIGTVLVILNVGLGFLAVAADAAVPSWVAVSVLLALNLVVLLGYPVAFETLWRGRTLGKAAMGLRVVTVEGAPVRFRHAAVRAALGLVDFVLTFGVAAVVSILVTRRHQRLGDLVAGTVVLRERTGAPAPRAATFDVPPGAQAYAATLDVSGLRPQDAATVRSFLLRAPTLAPDVRGRLAATLAEGVAGRLRHVRPADVSPETFLACVAARRQQRGGAAADGRPTGTPAGPAPADPHDGAAPPP